MGDGRSENEVGGDGCGCGGGGGKEWVQCEVLGNISINNNYCLHPLQFLWIGLKLFRSSPEMQKRTNVQTMFV